MVYMYLPRLLGERRMTQVELARLTGIRPNTINDLYHGTAERVSFEHLDLICEALGCQLKELLDRKPNEIRRTGKDLIIEEHGLRKDKK
jgi:putative transcriptional regulator